MKIKTRFAVSNALMVLLSLFILLLICGIVINVFKNIFYRPDNMMLDENSHYVQEILEKAQSGDDNQQISDSVGHYGYSLYVIQNGETVFSSGDDDIKVEHIMSAPNWKDGKSKCMVMDGATIVGVKNGDTSYVAVKGALLDKKPPFKNNKTQIENFLITFIILGILAIIIIFIISQLYSKRMIKRITNPLDELTQAAGRIQQGDLTHQITYNKDDEFKTVINAFNQMQLHLMSEQEKTATYEKARTDMIAGISHDLRTPLTSIKGYIKGLSDGVATTPERQQQYLDIAYKRSCDMEVLLQKLFYFSKLETGNMPLNTQQCNLAEFAKDFVSEASLELSQNGIDISFECDNQEHNVLLDVQQMSRILTNLVDNSIKYANAKDLQLCIKVWRDEDTEYLSFSDNGQGVPDDMVDKIFDCFFRVDEARGFSNGEGSGLGLHIVKHIVEMHGGSVRSYNKNGLVTEIALPHIEEDTNEQNTDS